MLFDEVVDVFKQHAILLGKPENLKTNFSKRIGWRRACIMKMYTISFLQNLILEN